MSTDYSYDEEGQFFPFFILTLTALVTLPLTWSLLTPSSNSTLPSNVLSSAPLQSGYKCDDEAVVQKVRSSQKKRFPKIKRFIFVVVGWSIIGLMLYLITVTQPATGTKVWNPYDILGLPDSASEKQIKSKYRRLSLKFHPDKIRPDAAKNETMEILTEQYVEITKAYQALTDEDVRNNYIQFGHPDGKQSYSIGIALPKFIISDGNGVYIVLVYTALLGVLLPYLVGSWWYGTQRMSKEGILIDSANSMFPKYDSDMKEDGVIEAVSHGKEFHSIIRAKSAKEGLAALEAKILPLLSAKQRQTLEEIDDPVRRKTLALLWAYLYRVDLSKVDPQLTYLQYAVAPCARRLANAFTVIALAFVGTNPVLASYSTMQQLTQAVAPGASPLLQLPYFDNDTVAAVEEDFKTHISVQHFMSLSDKERRKQIVESGHLTEEQYRTAIGVAKQLPHFRVAKAFFKVPGERVVIPSSLITFVIKGRFIPPGSVNIPEINPYDLEDIDAAEDDVEAITGRRKKRFFKTEDGKIQAVEDVPVQPSAAFAPRLGGTVQPSWSVFLADSKQNKVAMPPFKFTQFERPIFEPLDPSSSEPPKPTFHMQTLKATLPAPPKPGNYTFVMHIICDSYIGLDTRMEVTLHVEEASKAAAMTADDEISEPDEDSLAGQMQALKTGQAPAPKSSKRTSSASGGLATKKSAISDDDDDESGTDDDDDDDTSSTNTDTEDES